VAAAWPEIVKSVVLIEGFGPFYRNASDVAKHFRLSCERRMKSNRVLYKDAANSPSNMFRGNRRHLNIGAAIETRMFSATLGPGNQYISRETAEALVKRAVILQKDGSVYFQHDSRLIWPTIQYNTQEQVEHLWANIKAPVCLIRANDGWPMEKDVIDNVMKQLRPLCHVELAGSHHLHADPETATGVISEIIQFLKVT